SADAQAFCDGHFESNAEARNEAVVVRVVNSPKKLWIIESDRAFGRAFSISGSYERERLPTRPRRVEFEIGSESPDRELICANQFVQVVRVIPAIGVLPDHFARYISIQPIARPQVDYPARD